MPSNKKRKRELSHAEIWDDSALINSWDEALEEYKHYHSIQARGERVETVLQAASAGVNGESNEKTEENGDYDAGNPTPAIATHNDELEDGEVEDIGDPTSIQPASNTMLQEAAHASEPPGDKQKPQLQPDVGRSSPSHKLVGVEDDGLRNLMMSWYYAGYYTGLFEGQQRRKEAEPW
ncbi:MAG: hypothetical protein M1817_004007 [Caeruleum heppii]|nr:MAG: hypothetical protein M1817_004007 [Caeruleum heppii]